MITKEVIDSIIEYTASENVKLEETLSGYTTFKIGGPAKCLVEIDTVKQLTDVSQYLKREKIPYYVLGNGSNTLFADEGYDGVVVHLGNKISDIRVEGNLIYAEAGAMLARVSKEAQKASLTGLEFAAGIPGTVGGGVVMNAGAYDGEMKQVVKAVSAVSPEGEFVTLSNEEATFGYRSSLMRHTGYVVTEVVFELQEGNADEILTKMNDFNERRRSKQPLEYPSAGSTFKRPEGYFAGKLIMDAGLRGYTVGGACVSEKHCGFVINKGGATAKDVVTLINDVKAKVKADTGIELEPEIEIIQ
jgi:UDP-N-acetylmuramate dehydrogenase